MVVLLFVGEQGTAGGVGGVFEVWGAEDLYWRLSAEVGWAGGSMHTSKPSLSPDATVMGIPCLCYECWKAILLQRYTVVQGVYVARSENYIDI